MRPLSLVSVLFLTLCGSLAAQDIDPALLAGMSARSIGPAGMSGRVAAIAIAKSDPDTLYVGAATGGVWRSRDGAVTFEPVFDDQPVHAIGAIAVNPHDSLDIWVGTGEGNLRNSASVGNGVYRSRDGGATWRHLGLENTERIHRVILDPRDANVAWVAALGKAWGENPERGVFKTTDGGETWRRVLYVDERTGAGELVADPEHPDHLLCSMWQYRRWPYFFRSGGPSSGVYASHDGGENWTRLGESEGFPSGPIGRVGLAFAPSDSRIVYALVEAAHSVLLRSSDGGRSFATVNRSSDVAPRPFYFNDLRVHPTQPDRLYSLDFTIRESIDGGRSFGSLSGAGSIHGDFHAMEFDPRDPRHVLVGDDGGVGETRDGGTTFRFVENLPLAQFYHVAVDDAVPYHVYGGLQDNGSWRGPSDVWRAGGIRNHEWFQVGDGDGFDVQPVPGSSTVGYSMAQGGYLMRFDLDKRSQRLIRPPPTTSGDRLRFNWNAGIATDPFDPNVVYYGSQFVHRSRDRGETWETISADLTTDDDRWQRQADSGGLTPDQTAAENHCTIMAIAPSAVERGVIWVGSDDGRLHVTRDGGANWTSVEKNVPGVPANTWIPHIEASKFAGGEAFVVFDDHRRSNLATYVYRTTDYGQTWTSLAHEGLRGYALVVEQDPVKREMLWLGTEFGLWLSLDTGARWMPWKHGLPTASVMDLVTHPREHDLVIATHGRALFVIDDVRPLRELTPQVATAPLTLFPIADARQHTIANDTGGFGFGAAEFRGASRAYGALLTFYVSSDDLPLPDSKAEKARKEVLRTANPLTWGPEKDPALAQVESDERAIPAQPKEPEIKKARLRIADATGRIVRTLEVPIVRGLNRAVWDLGRDAAKRPRIATEPERDATRESGPQVAPGEYSATLSFGGHESKQAVRILADAVQGVSAEGLAKREAALTAVHSLFESATKHSERIRELNAELDRIMAIVNRRAAAKKTGAAESEEKPATEPDDPLLAAALDAKRKLAEIERRLWQAQPPKGIIEDESVLAKIFEAYESLAGSIEAPSPTHEIRIEIARSKLETWQTAFREVQSTLVGPFATLVRDRGLGAFEATVDEK